MGQFDDIIGTPKRSKKKLKVPCRKCGSTNTETSHKMYTGTVFNYNRKVYRRYRQFVRCYDCNKVEVITDSDTLIGDPPEDVINVVPRKITTAYSISLPRLRNVSPVSILDELMDLDELIEDF